MFLQFLANGLAAGAIFGLVALGFGLIYNTTGVFHVAHGAVYAVSGYALCVFMAVLGFPLAVSVGAAVVVGTLFGFLLERWVYLPLDLRRASSGAVFVSSLGVYTVSVNALAAFFGNDALVVPSKANEAYHLGSVAITGIQLAGMGSLAALSGLAGAFLRGTSCGKFVRAMADNPDLLGVVGVDRRLLRGVVFSVGSALAAFGACLVALDVGVTPNAGMDMVLVAAVSVIIASRSVLEGGALGGLIVGVFQSLVVWQVSAEWKQAATLVLLLGILAFRREGLLATTSRIENA